MPHWSQELTRNYISPNYYRLRFNCNLWGVGCKVWKVQLLPNKDCNNRIKWKHAKKFAKIWLCFHSKTKMNPWGSSLQIHCPILVCFLNHYLMQQKCVNLKCPKKKWNMLKTNCSIPNTISYRITYSFVALIIFPSAILLGMRRTRLVLMMWIWLGLFYYKEIYLLKQSGAIAKINGGRF